MQQYITGLEIAVNDAAAVDDMHCLRQILDQDRRGRGRLGPAAEMLRQAAAGDVLHGEEGTAAGAADVEDLNDVRVLQSAQSLRLGAEARQLRGVRARALQDHLQSDEAVELKVAGLINDPHATAADLH